MTSRRRARGGSVKTPVLEFFKANPGVEWRRREVAESIGMPDTYDDFGVWEKGVGQAMNGLAARGAIGRIEYGVYIYPPEMAPPFKKGGRDRPEGTVNARNAPRPESTPDELRPIIEAIPDDAYKAAGLQPVATAAGGGRICLDDQGTAWIVRIIIDARLI